MVTVAKTGLLTVKPAPVLLAVWARPLFLLIVRLADFAMLPLGTPLFYKPNRN